MAEDEKMTVSRPEKLSSILGNEVITYTEEEPETQKDKDHVYVYRGDALNEEELFQLSAREDIKLVLIAGPHYSGKTTLIVMLYYLFLEGLNCTFRFGGSLTIDGFKNRARKIQLDSGEATPVVERTSRSEQNRYLHLVLADKNGRKSNLILTDISGELFTSDYMEKLYALYGDCENVILTMDGEKLQDPIQRQNEIMQTRQLLKNLLSSEVIAKHSKLQIICTKKDIIEEKNQFESTVQFLEKKWNNIQTSYASYVYSLEFQIISALNLDCEDTPKSLEQIIQRCLECAEREPAVPPDEPELRRHFDKFRARG